MAQGTCDDLASTLLLATDKPVLVAPSMNVRMWHHPATQRNLNVIRDDGIITIGPNEGDMACGEFGLGRMSEPSELITFLISYFKQGPLSGKRIIVTSGTTHEMMDPIRYIANKSSGAQGTAIANALADFQELQEMAAVGPVRILPISIDLYRGLLKKHKLLKKRISLLKDCDHFRTFPIFQYGLTDDYLISVIKKGNFFSF